MIFVVIFVKMSVFEKLQKVGQEKPYNGFKKLTIGYHKILRFRVVSSKFATSSVLVELKKEVIFLPNYFTYDLTEEELKELTSPIVDECYYLYFGGERKREKNK